MASAWQLALGFAMVGELGAIYFTVFNRRPLLAGAFFALAFGNRTEVLLTAPIFMFLLTQKNFNRGDATTNEINKPKIVKSNIEEEYAFKEKFRKISRKTRIFPNDSVILYFCS
jgi:hypothetical protein